MHATNLMSAQVGNCAQPVLVDEEDLFAVGTLAWSRLDTAQSCRLRTHFQKCLPPPSSTESPVLAYGGTSSGAAGFACSDAFELPPGLNGLGWDTLRVSFSGSLTTMQQLAETYGTDLRAVTVLDLQQESHAIIDEYPVAWEVSGALTNVGWSAEQVTNDETQRINALRAEPVVTLVHRHWLQGERDNAEARHLVSPSISCEQSVVEASGACYRRIPVANYSVPDSAAVDDFISLEQSLSALSRLHIHCRQGKGRTATFLTIHDMLRNAEVIPLAELIARQRAFHPIKSLAEPSDIGETHHVTDTCKRLQFLRLFYEYARSNPMGAPQAWSAWLASPVAERSQVEPS